MSTGSVRTLISSQFMRTDYTVGVTGLGSMGSRRMRDLIAIGIEKIVAFDIREDRRTKAAENLGVNVVDSEEELFQSDLDALIISTPPDQHLHYYSEAFIRNINFFSEANIFTPRPEWFAKKSNETGVLACPSCTWRHYPLFKELKKQVEKEGLNNITSVMYQYGCYLPYWHPWEDVSEFYAGNKLTAASREMVPFELEWMTWLFGKVKRVSAIYKKCSDLNVDIYDTYYLVLEFESGKISTLMIDVTQRTPVRYGKIMGNPVSIDFDVSKNTVSVFDIENDCWTHNEPTLQGPHKSNIENCYYDELVHFIESVSGDVPYCKTWSEDRHLSDVLYAAEKSWNEKSWVVIEDVADEYDGMEWIDYPDE